MTSADMARKEKLIGLAVATALGVGSFAALKYNQSFEKTAEALREQILSRVAEKINYAEISHNPHDLASFAQQIPGEWRTSSLIADILVDPVSFWRRRAEITKSTVGPGMTTSQEFREADQQHLAGLFVYREHTENLRSPRFFRDIVTMGKVTNWLVGENYIPK